MIKRHPLRISRAVIFALILREIQNRFGSRRMGAFWLFFEPIAHVLALIAIFIFLRRRDLLGVDYPMFLITGIVPFIMIKNVTFRTMDAVNANRALFAYRQIRPLDTMFARAVLELVLSACVFALLMFGMWMWGGHVVIFSQPLQWLLAVLTAFIFAFSLGIIFCILAEAFPNVKSIIKLVFMPLYFISGVIFPIWSFHPDVLKLISWNPILHLIDALRYNFFSFYYKTDGIGLEYPIKVTIALLVSSLFLYQVRRTNLISS